MSLDDWLRNDWLKRHTTTKAEIEGLLAIVDRELQDSQVKGVSADGRFNLGDRAKDDSVYLQSCRAKRNAAEYDAANEASETECAELIEFAKEFRATVRAWLRKSNVAKPRS